MGACGAKLQKENKLTEKDKEKYKVECPSNLQLPECPTKLLSAKSLTTLSMIKQRNEFVRIDKLLSAYYRQFRVTDYMDPKTKIGRFLQYIIDNKLMDIDLSDYNEETNDLSYTRFDPKFPISNETIIYIQSNNINKEHVVYYVIRFCLEYNAHPTPNRYIKFMSSEQFNSRGSLIDLKEAKVNGATNRSMTVAT